MEVNGTRATYFDTDGGRDLGRWMDECAADGRTGTYHEIGEIIDKLNAMDEAHREEREIGGCLHR
jgi:hypothetical protein